AVALSIVDTAVGRLMQRSGRIVTFAGLGAAVARGVLPEVGARAPSAAGLRCSSLVSAGEDLAVELDRTFPPPALPAEAVRALELGNLASAADDALAKGELDAARALYVALLERAPRHPEICRLVAEIDALSQGRAEGALSFLVEALPIS